MIVNTHLSKILLNHARFSVRAYSKHRQSTSLLLICVKYSTTIPTTTTTTSTSQRSFVVSYLINTCGLSPQAALSASKYVKFETPDKPDSVLSCLESHGFSKTQISLLVRRCPAVLLNDVEKNLSPKLEFFHSKGISRTDLARIFSAYPTILRRSLQNCIVPSFNFFKSLLQSDDQVSRVFARCPLIIAHLEDYVKSNINTLRSNGMPESNIVRLIQSWPTTFVVKSERFNKKVKYVNEMGLNFSNINFVRAIAAKSTMAESTWKSKVVLYESWGWSKEEILVAFQKNPWCMSTSENKINAVMDFFINKMCCESSYIARYPVFFSYSLEKRIVPRCSVIKVLLLKGLIKQTCLSSMLKISEKLFVQKLVTRYEKEAPDLLKLYQEKLNLCL